MVINKDFYRKKGFLHLKNFFDQKQIVDIYQQAKYIFFSQFIEKKYIQSDAVSKINENEYNNFLYKLFSDDVQCFTNCGKQVQHLISVHKLSLDKKIVELLTELGLKYPVISTRPVVYFNHPHLAKEKVYHTVDAHQDWRSMQGSLNSVVIWVPLMDIDQELGALKILPGSHLQGLRTDHIKNGFGMVSLSPEESKNLLSIEVNRGDILLFSSFLIHQSGENITNRPRWSAHFRYNDIEEATFIKRKFAHPYVYMPNSELLTKGFPKKRQLRNYFEKKTR